MVQLNPDYEQKQATVGTNDSFTIPSGEVWRATVVVRQGSVSGDDAIINGATIQTGDSNPDTGTSSTTTVLTGGTQLSTNNNCSMFISGHDVTSGNNPIENTPIDIGVVGGNTTTVPAGEMWDVTLTWRGVDDNGEDTTVDGTIIQLGDSWPNSNMFVTTLTLSENTTIYSDHDYHIGGFKV